jgi:hypothetical protein
VVKPEEMDRLIEEHVEAEMSGDSVGSIAMYTEDVEHDVVGSVPPTVRCTARRRRKASTSSS